MIEPQTMRMSKIRLSYLTTDRFEETNALKDLFGDRMEKPRPGEDRMYLEDYSKFTLDDGRTVCLVKR